MSDDAVGRGPTRVNVSPEADSAQTKVAKNELFVPSAFGSFASESKARMLPSRLNRRPGCKKLTVTRVEASAFVLVTCRKPLNVLPL